VNFHFEKTYEIEKRKSKEGLSRGPLSGVGLACESDLRSQLE
jgi:hypothetical protein